MFNLINSGIWSFYGQPVALSFYFESFFDAIKSEDITEKNANYKLPLQKFGANAVIDVKGPIIKDGGWFADYFGLASSRRIQKSIIDAVNDSQIEQIILSIDSPGGSVDGLSDVGDAVKAANTVKPVISHVDGMAASAAYYIAAQSSKIYANRMDLIGSIGTRMLLLDYSEMAKNEGIKVIPIDTGKFKSAAAPGTKITDEQIADFQRIVNDYFYDFRSVVMSGRNMSSEQFKTVSDGRVWLANDAITLGLIDGIKNISESFLRGSRSVKSAKLKAKMLGMTS